MAGRSTVSASCQRAPMVIQRDWSRSGATGITCTGQLSGETFSSQRDGSNRLRGNGHQPLRV